MKNKVYKKDLYRYYGKYKETFRQKIFRPQELKYIILFRKTQNSHGLLKIIYRYKLRKISIKTHIQIPYQVEIDEGFYIGHCGRIIINPKVKIGKNVNIATGITIGQENRGKREGTPNIGNDVWIGTNSVIVGNIKSGNDVLIAPGAFVNFDVPSHSIVVGNPGKIIFNQFATQRYINRRI